MKVTLEFDDEEAADNFITWWLDGGGQKNLDYYTQQFAIEKQYLRVKGKGIIDVTTCRNVGRM